MFTVKKQKYIFFLPVVTEKKKKHFGRLLSFSYNQVVKKSSALEYK